MRLVPHEPEIRIHTSHRAKYNRSISPHNPWRRQVFPIELWQRRERPESTIKDQFDAPVRIIENIKMFILYDEDGDGRKKEGVVGCTYDETSAGSM